MTDDEQAIRQLIERWMEASRRGDLDTVLSLMTDDVVFMVPGREPFGKTEFASTSARMADAKVDGRSEVVELRVLGDWAWLRNRLDLTITPPNSPPMHRSGYTLTLLRKEEDDHWRLARDANLVT
jgi:uncharacterized protein (TIGR02246 family)